MEAKQKLKFISALLVLGLFLFITAGEPQKGVQVVVDAKNEVLSLVDDKPETQEERTEDIDVARKFQTLKQFSPIEFKQAYDSLGHPNITPIVHSPEITGSAVVDEHIRKTAEARGYQLQLVASGILNSSDDVELQELLISDWKEMVDAALAEGVNMFVRSGYRSIEDQRDLFLSRLAEAGLNTSNIVDSSSQGALAQVLSLAAPPGYSRHHSGYTIDVGDPGYSFFAGSTAYVWLSGNNFENAKRFGFVPGYPDGIANQGPNPEPWEFVWVSKNVTYED